MSIRTQVWGMVAVASMMLAAPAYAEFDATTGRVTLAGYALAVSFDDGSDLGALGPYMYLSGDLAAVAPPQTLIARDERRVLEGTGALRLDRAVQMAVTSLDRAAPRLRGQAVRWTAWIRPEGSEPVLDLIYGVAVEDRLDPEGLFSSPTSVRFMPTGRATDDGWREVSTGVVDFSLFGALEARRLRIMDVRLPEALLFGVSSNLDGEAWVDGLSVEIVAAQRVPAARCTLPTERTVCGDLGACHFGRCVDAAVVVGDRAGDEAVRFALHERLGFRMELLAGGRIPRGQAPAFRERLAQAARDPIHAEAQATFARAFDDLADGHVSPPLTRLPSTVADSICMYVGEADLLPQGGLHPLVLEIDPRGPMASRLEVGDALVAIDGSPVQSWARGADRFLRYAGDPRGRDFVVTPQLWAAAVQTGAELTFHRCPSTIGCTPDQVVSIRVNLAELAAPIWERGALDWMQEGLTCDFRFRRDLNPPDVREGDFAGHIDRGNVRTILINGVSGFGRWRTAVEASLQDLPERVILDQRTGGGGTFTGVSLLLEPFLYLDEDPWVHLVPQLAPEADIATIDRLVRCQMLGVETCGNFFALPLANGSSPRALAPEAWIAVLNAYDVSGNDYLPTALGRRRGGRTRMFGAVPTFGAFGPIYSLPRIMGELYGGSVQLHDTVFLEGARDRSLAFTTGLGVEPDEVVYQRQSDARIGVDTVLRAARDWLEGRTR